MLPHIESRKVSPHTRVDADENRPQGLGAIRDKLVPVFKSHGILKAFVFGSYARGDASRHSDLDLIVIARTAKRFFDRYDGLYLDACHAVGNIGIDLLVYTPEELSGISHRRFIQNALATGRVIYESTES